MTSIYRRHLSTSVTCHDNFQDKNTCWHVAEWRYLNRTLKELPHPRTLLPESQTDSHQQSRSFNNADEADWRSRRVRSYKLCLTVTNELCRPLLLSTLSAPVMDYFNVTVEHLNHIYFPHLAQFGLKVISPFWTIRPLLHTWANPACYLSV